MPYSFHFASGEYKTLYVTPEGEEAHELMTALDINGALTLYHLDTPPGHSGNGLGRLGVAFFYYLMQQEEYAEYAVKFGGGQASAGFLARLGFAQEYIVTASDTDFPGDSVMVGAFTSTGERPYDWNLDPIPAGTFPTEFFSLG